MIHEQIKIMNTRGQHIIDVGFQKLKAQLGERLTRVPVEQVGRAQADGYDEVFELEGHRIAVKARQEIRSDYVRQLVHGLQLTEDLLLIAGYITPEAKEMLRSRGINYADRAGNIWLQKGQILIYVEGVKNSPPSEDRKNRAFTQSGLKVLFQILLNQDLIRANYREIAAASHVSLGTIPKVIEGLKEEGMILRHTKTAWMIADRKGLLEQWQQEYNRKLKPRLLLKRCRAVNRDFYRSWKQTALPAGTLWGGEPAADLLTGYLKPELFTIYSELPIHELLLQLKWVPDPEGDIFIYQKFWAQGHENKPYVPAILAYADLVGTNDDRCFETATMIYDQFIRQST